MSKCFRCKINDADLPRKLCKNCYKEKLKFLKEWANHFRKTKVAQQTTHEVSSVTLTKKTTTRKKTSSSLSLCEICSIKPAEHIHHKDLNHKNNDPSNLQPVCTLCHAKIHGIEPRIFDLKTQVLLLNKTQQARIAIDNQIRGFSRIEIIVPEFMHELSASLTKKEKEYEKQIKHLLEGKNHIHQENQVRNENPYPVYSWLKQVKGISHNLSAKLIAFIDIEKSPTVSSLWKYCGMAPDSKKKKGKTANYNHNLKPIMYQIADSFIKQNTPKYREIYDKEKARQLILMEEEKSQHPAENHHHKGSPPSSKMHAHKRAMRVMVKAFLKDLWIQWKSISEEKNLEMKEIHFRSVPLLTIPNQLKGGMKR